MITLEVLDPVWVRTDHKGFLHLNSALSYEHKYWRKIGHRKEQVSERHYMIEQRGKDEFYFLSGLLDRAERHLERNDLEYEIIDNLPDVEFDEPHLDGVTFMKHQKKLIKCGIEIGRGLIVAPTGTGKSYIIAGISSAFVRLDKILFLVHTTDLVAQMKADFVKFFGEENVGEWSGARKNINTITVATHQSFVKVCDQHVDTFGVVLIDEGHHVSDINGNYGKILQRSAAHTKLGFTATKGDQNKTRWAAEALLGPVIGEYKIQDAQKDNVLTKPEIHIYTVTSGVGYENVLEDYPEKYHFGIIDNFPRNRTIAKKAIECAKKGETTLVTIKNIEHGHILQELFADYGYHVPFVYGESSSAERDAVKNGLKDGSLKLAITSVIFVEGIDIPVLNTVINAAAGRSSIQTVQRIGRALRKAKGKSGALLIDFYDKTIGSLERQSKARIDIYKSRGWKVIRKKG